jgi:hypothetical protein
MSQGCIARKQQSQNLSPTSLAPMITLLATLPKHLCRGETIVNQSSGTFYVAGNVCVVQDGSHWLLSPCWSGKGLLRVREKQPTPHSVLALTGSH